MGLAIEHIHIREEHPECAAVTLGALPSDLLRLARIQRHEDLTVLALLS